MARLASVAEAEGIINEFARDLRALDIGLACILIPLSPDHVNAGCTTEDDLLHKHTMVMFCYPNYQEEEEI